MPSGVWTCLWTILHWHCRHPQAQVRTSLFISDQTNLCAINLRVALIPGCDRLCSAVKTCLLYFPVMKRPLCLVETSHHILQSLECSGISRNSRWVAPVESNCWNSASVSWSCARSKLMSVIVWDVSMFIRDNASATLSLLPLIWRISYVNCEMKSRSWISHGEYQSDEFRIAK